MRRSEAYEVLAREMNMTIDECHMKLMSEAQAKRVPAIATMILEKLRADRDRSTRPRTYRRGTPQISV